MYPTKESVIDAVKFWSLSLRRQFKVVKSSKREYNVKCLVPECPYGCIHSGGSGLTTGNAQ